MRTVKQPYLYPTRKVQAAAIGGILAMLCITAWTFRAWLSGGNVQVTIGPLIGGVYVFCCMFLAAYFAKEYN